MHNVSRTRGKLFFHYGFYRRTIRNKIEIISCWWSPITCKLQLYFLYTGAFFQPPLIFHPFIYKMINGATRLGFQLFSLHIAAIRLHNDYKFIKGSFCVLAYTSHGRYGVIHFTFITIAVHFYFQMEYFFPVFTINTGPCYWRWMMIPGKVFGNHHGNLPIGEFRFRSADGHQRNNNNNCSHNRPL